MSIPSVYTLVGDLDIDGTNGTLLSTDKLTFDGLDWVFFEPNNNAGEGDKDLWPGWYVHAKINNLVAPFGQQSKALGTQRAGFRSTIMCGNENRDAFEGEKATAWHVQQIDEAET